MKLRYFFLMAVLSFCNSCTHVFLQPSKVKFFDPKSVGIHYEEKFVKSWDETPLAYWYFPAQNYEAKGAQPPKTKGLLLHFHGNAENMSSHFKGVMWPLLEGIDVVTFDYRAYGASSGERNMDGTYGDALFMLKWAEKEAEKKDVPLIVFGQSLGGALLLKALTDHKPKNLKLVIVESSFYSYQKMAREKLSEHWLTFLIQPLAYILVSDKYSPGNDELEIISPTPTILIYGTQDSVVGHHHGEALYEKLKKPKQLWKHNNPGHINALWVERGKYKFKLIEELHKFLK